MSLLFCDIAHAERVWIDTDVAIGAPWRELDDAFALLLAFHSPELDIAGISSSYGNASLPRTTSIAQNLVARFATEVIAVHAGACDAAELGKRTAATEALAAALERERLTYVALGPLTNLATCLRLHPALGNRITRVIFVGGQSSAASLRFGEGGWLKIHDANVIKDRAAVAAVLASHVPLMLAPAEVGARLTVTTADLRQLSRHGPAGVFLQRRTTAWLWFWRHVVKAEGGPLFDVLPLLVISGGGHVRTEAASATMDADLRFSPKPSADGRKVTICSQISPNAKAQLLRRLTN